MIDTTNPRQRYIITPDGIAELDVFIADPSGTIDMAWVWLGERSKQARLMRPHRVYRVDECEEVEK